MITACCHDVENIASVTKAGLAWSGGCVGVWSVFLKTYIQKYCRHPWTLVVGWKRCMRIKIKRWYEGYQTIQGKSGELGAIVGLVRTLVVFIGWIFCVVGCHTTGKGADLSYELDYAILLLSWILSQKYPHFMIISTFCGYYTHSLEISMSRGYYPHFVNIFALCGYYPKFLEISTLYGYHPHFVDISEFSG